MTKHPIEVITSVERRRRWSREDKERLVAACFEPDAVISEIARAAGIHVSQLFRWRKELCRIGGAEDRDGNHVGAGDRVRDRAGSLSRSNGTAHHIPSSSQTQRCND
ncbi:transposase (plasmid) [Rhizobium leguminosarum]|nr:transposase [Rhizobium leguminosarum]